MDHRLLVVLAMAHLIGLGCCIVESHDSSDRGETKKDGLTDVENDSDDLDAQETGWLLDEKMRKLEYLKNKVIYPFTALKSSSYGGGGGAVYPVYGGVKPGFSYGGGVSPSFSYGANFNPSISYGASFNPGISYGGSFNPGYSFGGGSSGFYPGYKQKFPFIGGAGYAPSYPIQPFPNKFNFYQKFNPASFKQFVPSIPQKPWYSSGFIGGYSKPSYAPDCNYYVYRTPPSMAQPAPVYTTGTPLSSYYSTVGPTQSYGSTKSAYLGGSAQVLFQSTLPSPVLQVPSPQVRDGSSWAPSSIPTYQQPSLPNPGTFSGYAPQYPNPSTSFPPPPNSWVAGTASYPSAPPSPPQTASTQAPSSYPLSWSYPGVSSLPSSPYQGSGGSQYIVVPQGSGSISSDQSGVAPQEVVITPAPPQARGQFITTLPGTGYPAAVYFPSDEGSTRDSSDSSGESQPSLTSESDESSGAHSESSESTTAAPPPPPPPPAAPTPPQPAPVLTTYYTSNTIDQARVPFYFYIQPVNGGFYSSPPGYGYSPYYPPVQTKQPATPRPC